MRKFICSLYHGEGNSTKTVEHIEADTSHKAMDIFVTKLGAIGYPLRQERPETIDGTLFSVWSCGCSISGQRVYVKEAI
jgi:hypothetical protein